MVIFRRSATGEKIPFKSRTPHTIKIGKYGPEIHIHWIAKKSMLLVSCCPAQVLQCHNVFGSDDLQFLVLEIAQVVFSVLDQPMPSDVRKRLENGDFELYEVHIAEQHRLGGIDIGDLSHAIRRGACNKLGATTLEEGVGVRLWPNSRDRTVLLYSKFVYLADKPDQHLMKFCGTLTDSALTIAKAHFADITAYAKLGVRIEVRLKRRALKNLKLNVGCAWSYGEARKQYLRVLETIPISTMSVAADSKLIAQLHTDHERMLVGLWLDGKRPADHCHSNAIITKVRNAVKKRLNIDICRPRVTLPELKWTELIAEASIVPPPKRGRADGILFTPQSPVSWLETAWHVSDTSQIGRAAA